MSEGTRGNSCCGEAVERQVAQRGGRGRDGGLRILLRAIQMRFLQRQLVGDVVPHQRRGGELDRVIKGGEGFVVLAEVEVSVAQADLQFGIVRSERRGFLQLGGSQVVLVPLGIHGAKAGVSELVERVDFDLLVEGGDGIVVFAFLPVGAAERVVGVFVVRIDFDLLLESDDGVVILAQCPCRRERAHTTRIYSWDPLRWRA